MKKRLTAALLIFGCALLADADFGKLYQEAEKAAKAKDYVTADAKYSEAMTAARDSQQKSRAILGKFMAMRNLKKWKESEDFVFNAVEDEMLKSPEIRHILNTTASILIWAPKIDLALDLLKQAQQQDCPQASNTYFATFYYMAYIYDRKKQPQTAIEVLDNILKVKSQHPANLYGANMMTGNMYEKLGKKDMALKHYRAALENGKKVRYKFDYSPAEKAIEKLSK